jgi:hypothetical protein
MQHETLESKFNIVDEGSSNFARTYDTLHERQNCKKIMSGRYTSLLFGHGESSLLSVL